MFKLKKKARKIIFFIIIVSFILYLLVITYRYICKLNSINVVESDTVEGFNIRQYYNSKKRNFNKIKNKYFYDGKIKIKKFLKNNNII